MAVLAPVCVAEGNTRTLRHRATVPPCHRARTSCHLVSAGWKECLRRVRRIKKRVIVDVANGLAFESTDILSIQYFSFFTKTHLFTVYLLF